MTQPASGAQHTHVSATYKLRTGNSDGSNIYNNLSNSEDSMVIILDLTPSAWAYGVSPIKHNENNRLYLQDMYNIIIGFLKSYAYMSINNRCCIIGTHNCGCSYFSKILYEGVLFSDWLPSCYDGEDVQDSLVETVTKRIWNEIVNFIEFGLDNPYKDAQLTSAISMGLLYLNRIEHCNIGTGKKIIIIDVSNAENYKSQYIGLMNIAFSASNLRITLNVCSLGNPSGILEQLGAITNAKYLLLSNVFQSETEVVNLGQAIFQLLTVTNYF
ncbi:hypothetical protein BEWA_010810 [Theileria equi strain WA]|uniref:RNA polymerase II transcription factor B subunit 4 n=1 Tax=Theileria equi strain WA TaxID=1537102 RepID=L0B3G7_THEEQ|nr:hypothetical protein BEWA_010810 [Theileria equi strain WA]AFZ81664.1 hypothetical protein BEWA_010810 [Theileria equi strain WA]|eukprot:XP_004831330.1 hypothetical protein BEWA_010810 [Theileria equi strain WA]